MGDGDLLEVHVVLVVLPADGAARGVGPTFSLEVRKSSTVDKMILAISMPLEISFVFCPKKFDGVSPKNGMNLEKKG